MRASLQTFFRTTLGLLLIALVAGCGGGDGDPPSQPATEPPPPPPGAVLVPFTDGDGVPGQFSNANRASGGALPAAGYVLGCINCIRVIAVAQDAESAVRAMSTTAIGAGIGRDFYLSPYLPKLAKVDFSKSTVVVFDRAVSGTSVRLTLTSVEEYEDRLRIRSELCAWSDGVRYNSAFDGFIVIPKRNKPAEFAPSDVTGLPPPPGYSPEFTLGQCRG